MITIGKVVLSKLYAEPFHHGRVGMANSDPCLTRLKDAVYAIPSRVLDFKFGEFEFP